MYLFIYLFLYIYLFIDKIFFLTNSTTARNTPSKDNNEEQYTDVGNEQHLGDGTNFLIFVLSTQNKLKYRVLC